MTALLDAQESPELAGTEAPEGFENVPKGVSDRFFALQAPLWTIDVVVLAGLGVVALWGFVPSFGAIGLIVGCIGLGVAATASLLLATRKAPVWGVAVAAFIVFVLVGGPLVVPGSTLFGFIPTPASLAQMLDGALRGWVNVVMTRPLIGHTGNLLSVPLLCGILIGSVSVSVARRSERLSSLALVPVIAVLVAATLVGVDHPVAILQGTVLALVGLVWAAYRQRIGRVGRGTGRGTKERFRTGALLLVLAGLVGTGLGGLALVSGSDHRFVLRDRVQPPLDSRLIPSPLASLRHFLLTNGDLGTTPLFEVTGLQKGERVRLATLDFYDGQVWRAAPTSQSFDSRDTFQRSAAKLQTMAVLKPGRSVTIRDLGYSGVWVPSIDGSTSVSFSGPRSDRLAADLRYNAATTSVAVPGEIRPGDVITVRGSGNNVSGEAAAQTPAPIDAPTQQINAWMASSGAAASPALASAKSLADGLRSGYYSDGDLSKRQEPALPGHGQKRIGDFLTAKPLVGNAEQYAASLGLVIRTGLGLPARVVVGFAPTVAGDGSATVRGSDATAWVEVGTDTGWVALSPTPSSDKINVKRSQAQVPPVNVVQTDPPLQLPDRSSVPRQRGHGTPPGCAITGTCGIGLTIPAWLKLTLGVPLLLAMLVAIPTGLIALAKARRRRARREAAEPAIQVAGGWAELCDLMTDVGDVVPRTATRRESAVLVGRPGVALAARGADELLFGPKEISIEDATTYWDRLEVTRAAIYESLSLFGKWRALVTISSVTLPARPTRIWKKGTP